MSFSLGKGGAVTGAGGAGKEDFEHGTSPVQIKSICKGKAIFPLTEKKLNGLLKKEKTNM